MNEDGQWVEGAADDDEWESAEEGEDEEMHDAMDIEDASGEWSPSTDTVIPPLPSEAPLAVGSTTPVDASSRPAASVPPSDGTNNAMDVEDESEEGSDKPWKRFEVLPAAPADHAFYNTTPAQPSRNFMTRLTKEYKALQNSLPGTFLPTARLHKLGSRPRAWPKLSSPN